MPIVKIGRVIPVALLATVMSATLVGCSSESPAASQSPTVAPTPTPTLTPTPMRAFEPYAIPAGIIPITDPEPCSVDVTITYLGPDAINYINNGDEAVDNIWCDGALHTWFEGAQIGDYLLTSDADTPLQFQLTPEGYLYVSGSGTVAQPDGTVVTLPIWSD